MKEKLFAEASEFIRQGANWQYGLIYELTKMKKIYGRQGVLQFLDEELAKYNRFVMHKGHYLMRLITVIERLQRELIPQYTYEKLPLTFWRSIINYVELGNAQEIVDYIHSNGQIKILKSRYEQGYELQYNLFSGEHEFIKKRETNENPQS